MVAGSHQNGDTKKPWKTSQCEVAGTFSCEKGQTVEWPKNLNTKEGCISSLVLVVTLMAPDDHWEEGRENVRAVLGEKM